MAPSLLGNLRIQIKQRRDGFSLGIGLIGADNNMLMMFGGNYSKVLNIQDLTFPQPRMSAISGA